MTEHTDRAWGLPPAQLRRHAATASIGAATTAAVGAVAALGLSAAVARRVLLVEHDRPDDVEVHAVEDGAVVVERTDETAVDGRYALWFDGGRGHARMGRILDQDRHRLRRELLGVDWGQLRPGPARFSAFYYGGDPLRALGVPFDEVEFRTDLGPMRAWEIPAPSAGSERWAVLVHGRGGTREEGLRAVSPLHAAGVNVLIPVYRNDIDAPAAPDGRYSLGLSEWRDLESACVLALQRGAREIVLGGWSMGGAIVLQMLHQSRLSPLVSRVFLDAPVVDWGDVLAHQAGLHRVPQSLATAGQHLMGRRSARRLVGVHETIDVAQTDWVRRADELTHPVLIIHSLDDEFVPAGPSLALAQARPDLVRWEPWRRARHTKEWNTDPGRWDALVRGWVGARAGTESP